MAHEPQAYDLYYNVVSNPVLWFVQHYLWGLVDAPDVDQGLHYAWSEGYEAVNASSPSRPRRARARSPRPGLHPRLPPLLAPRLACGRARPTPSLGHFVHIPWPQPDYWRVLPEPIRRAIHESLLANDVIGFHT